MTRDEFKNLLKANGITFVGEAAWRVAQLVAAHEREECAKILEDNADSCDPHGLANNILISNAAAIRARGQG